MDTSPYMCGIRGFETCRSAGGFPPLAPPKVCSVSRPSPGRCFFAPRAPSAPAPLPTLVGDEAPLDTRRGARTPLPPAASRIPHRMGPLRALATAAAAHGTGLMLDHLRPIPNADCLPFTDGKKKPVRVFCWRLLKTGGCCLAVHWMQLSTMTMDAAVRVYGNWSPDVALFGQPARH